MTVEEVVHSLAAGLKQADALRPCAVNKRSGSPYQPGIGPHSESESLTLAISASGSPNLIRADREVPYPHAPRNRCDLVLNSDEPWAIEVKMLRLLGDNGKPNDNMLMHILSPYAAHRSAVTDCEKLLASGFSQPKALVIFGYDYTDWEMDPAVEAFEALAARRAHLTKVAVASFGDLVHPVHKRGRIFGWELCGRR